MANDILPPATEYEKAVLGYAKEAIEEGEAFLKSQKGYDKINDCIAACMGEDRDVRSAALSSTSVNLAGKILTDITAMCTDVKPFWEYRTQNTRFKKHVEIHGKLSEHWWLNRLIDLKNASVIQYSCVAGTGYAHQFFNTLIQDLDMSAEDPRDVLPIRPPSESWSIQECFGVIHRVQRTVNYVRSRFPAKADLIKPDRDGSMVSSLVNTRAGKILDKLGSPFRERLFGNKPEKEIPRIPTVDLYTLYIADPALNDSSTPARMGEFTSEGKPKNNWSYEAAPGEPLYPRKRVIVFTNTAVLYDGPNIYWHGLFPFAKLTLDPLPWTWLGKGVLWDILPIAASLNRLLRVIDDVMEQIARPDVVADKNAISKAELDRIDTRRAGKKFRHNPLGGKGLTIERHPGLPADVYKMLEYYEQKAYELPGVRDMSNLMKLNQVPAPETVERMLEAMSPSVRLRSRVIEAYMRDFATMTCWNFGQFYTLPERLTILGDQGATEDDFDLDPDSFIPAWMESDFSPEGIVTAEALSRGPMPRYDRAREFYKQISYHVAPSSLLNASEIERQLKYLQLARAGLIDHWTLLDVLQVPNVGNPPPGATTITERLMAEQQMQLGMQVAATGRKASGQEPPQQKSSGAISESG